MGAGWVPDMLRRLDHAAEIWSKSEPELREMKRRPSQQASDQLRFTPYPFEDVGLLCRVSDPSLYLFSSDYPHAEGGRDPLGRFSKSLADCERSNRRRIFRRECAPLARRVRIAATRISLMLKTVQLGRNSGLRVSRLCLGTMNFGEPGRGHQGDWTLGVDDARPIFKAAIDRGLFYFDCADVYGIGASEQVVGAAAARTAAPRRVRARNEDLHADGPRRQPGGAVAQARDRRCERVPEAARARLHRPPGDPSSPARRSRPCRGAHRGVDGGAARRREGGQSVCISAARRCSRGSSPNCR